MSRNFRLTAAIGTAVLATFAGLTAPGTAVAEPAPGFTELVSVSTAGAQGIRTVSARR